eukprot:g1568.t1
MGKVYMDGFSMEDLKHPAPLTRKVTRSTQLLYDTAKALGRGKALKKMPVDTSQDVFVLDRSSTSDVDNTSPGRERKKKDKKLAIFKPQHRLVRTVSMMEENGEDGNASASSKDSSREGISEEAKAIRERVAYLLDASNGHYSKVPPCRVVTMTAHAKLNRKRSVDIRSMKGTLHVFEPHSDVTENVGPGQFCVSEVHKIAALDLRLFNTDRNGSNILVSGKPFKTATLTPIDHSLILPDYRKLNQAFFCWAWWKQVKEPFDESARKYIESLNPDKDAQTLKEEGIEPESIVTMRICTEVLKICARSELTVAAIASIYQQGIDDKPSLLERAVSEALEEERRSLLLTANGTEKESTDDTAEPGDRLPGDVFYRSFSKKIQDIAERETAKHGGGGSRE